MTPVKSQCIVCLENFPVSCSKIGHVSKSFKHNFSIFCSYLNIQVNGQRGENDDEIWDSACESFSFCVNCKKSVDKLYKLHNSKLSFPRNIGKIVATIIKTIIVAETTQNNKKEELSRNGQEKENGLNSEIPAQLKDTQDNSTSPPVVEEEKKIIVNQIMDARIQNVRRRIKIYYTPQVILTDCKNLLKDSAQPKATSASDQDKNCESNSEESDEDDEVEWGYSGNETTEESSEDQELEELPVEKPPSKLRSSGRHVSNKKRNREELKEIGSTTSDDEKLVKTKQPKLKTDISSKIFKIELLEGRISKYGQWKIEEVEVGPEKKFKCVECGHSNTRRSALVKHINNVHILCKEGNARSFLGDDGLYHYKSFKFEKADPGFKCCSCGRMRKNKHSLINHINEFHDDSKTKWQCEICRRIFFKQEGIENHVCAKKVKPRELKHVHIGDGLYTYLDMWHYTKLDIVGFQCETCSAFKSSMDRMAAHIRERHIDPSKYSCPACGYACGNPSMMKQHQNIHNPDRKFVCDVCKMKFATQSRLTSHQVGHRQERFQCTECDKSFQYQNGLGRHCRKTKHMESRPTIVVNYDCPKCDKNLRSQKRLEKHMPKCVGKKGMKVTLVSSKNIKQNNKLITHIEDNNEATQE